MDRVLVVGTTGSGKTTVASELARILRAPHFELDALFWEPNWVEADTEEFRRRVHEATSGERWVVDGNYLGRLGDGLWQRADTVVWLDIALSVILLRLVRRTISRSLRRTSLWAGNRERLSNLWNKEESLVAWARQTHTERRAEYRDRMLDPRWKAIEFIRLESPRQARRWLSGVSR